MQITEVELTKLDIKPGQFLLFRPKHPITGMEANALRTIVREALPGVPFLIVPPSIDVEVGQAP
jgi:hypothetical protein